MQAICCGRRAAANFWFLLRLGRLQYFISQFCNTKNLLRPQKKWLKISLTVLLNIFSQSFEHVHEQFMNMFKKRK